MKLGHIDIHINVNKKKITSNIKRTISQWYIYSRLQYYVNFMQK